MTSTLSHDSVAPVQSHLAAVSKYDLAAVSKYDLAAVSKYDLAALPKYWSTDGDLLDRLAVSAFVAVAIIYAAAATYGLLW